jgi:hypothetical protein
MLCGLTSHALLPPVQHTSWTRMAVLLGQGGVLCWCVAGCVTWLGVPGEQPWDRGW